MHILLWFATCDLEWNYMMYSISVDFIHWLFVWFPQDVKRKMDNIMFGLKRYLNIYLINYNSWFLVKIRRVTPWMYVLRKNPYCIIYHNRYVNSTKRKSFSYKMLPIYFACQYKGMFICCTQVKMFILWSSYSPWLWGSPHHCCCTSHRIWFWLHQHW